MLATKNQLRFVKAWINLPIAVIAYLGTYYLVDDPMWGFAIGTVTMIVVYRVHRWLNYHISRLPKKLSPIQMERAKTEFDRLMEDE